MRASAGQPGWLDEAARSFWLLSSPKRLRIILCLLKGEMAVNEIVTNTGFAQPTVSQHLGKLLQAGAVAVSKKDRQRWYRLTDQRLAQLMSGFEKAGWGISR